MHVYGSTIEGVDAHLLTAAEALARLDQRQLREMRVRIRCALEYCGIDKGQINEFNAWAHNHNGGNEMRCVSSAAALDLTIATGWLQEAGKLAEGRERALVFGELSLNGDARGARGLIPTLQRCYASGVGYAYVPAVMAQEAAAANARIAEMWPGPAMEIFSINSLQQVIDQDPKPAWVEPGGHVGSLLSDIGGVPADLQPILDRAVELARGGRHILLRGAPGSGKTMVARRIARALPRPEGSFELEIAAIQSAAGIPVHLPSASVPFRAPHHTASIAALLGSRGTAARPGEVTLAHNGVLFLDEVAEFSRNAIDGVAAAVQRGSTRTAPRMPARALVVAATNLCPGSHGSAARSRPCTCHPESIRTYHKRYERIVETLKMTTIDMPA